MLTSTRFWTPDQVADHLQVTRRTVYRWMEEGRLPACKAGNHWRIAEHDIEDFLRYKGRYASARVSDRFTDRELDAEISRAVLGNETMLTPEGWRQQLPDRQVRELPRYSSDQAAADQLREEVMQRKRWEVRVRPPEGTEPQRWFAYLFVDNRHACGAGAPTYELAICRVVLKQHYLSVADQLRASMPRMTVPSEVLIREDRDSR